jgi:hypothetical protein
MHIRPLLLLLALAKVSTAAKQTCVMPHTDGGDDSPGILSAAKSCLNDSTIVFSQGITYNLLTPLSFLGLQDVEFSFKGNISLSKNVSEVEAVVTNAKVYPGRWITIKGTNVVFSGSRNPKGGWFLGERLA